MTVRTVSRLELLITLALAVPLGFALRGPLATASWPAWVSAAVSAGIVVTLYLLVGFTSQALQLRARAVRRG